MLRMISVLLALVALPAHAQTPMNPGDLVSMELLPGWSTDRGTVMSAVRFRLAPGWKTYWRAPGEAGIPPQFSWSESENLGSAGFHWPVPDVFTTSGLRSIGYHDEVVIPLELTPQDPSDALFLAGHVDLGICDEICVPVSLDFATDLAVGTRRDPAIVAALVNRPLTADEAGVSDLSCSFAPEDDGMRITAAMNLASGGLDEMVVIEAGGPGVWVSPAQSAREGGRLVASAMVKSTGDMPVVLDREHLRLTIIDDHGAVDIRGCPAPRD